LLGTSWVALLGALADLHIHTWRLLSSLIA
jgi:hypothetical protein